MASAATELRIGLESLDSLFGFSCTISSFENNGFLMGDCVRIKGKENRPGSYAVLLAFNKHVSKWTIAPVPYSKDNLDITCNENDIERIFDSEIFQDGSAFIRTSCCGSFSTEIRRICSMGFKDKILHCSAGSVAKGCRLMWPRLEDKEVIQTLCLWASITATDSEDGLHLFGSFESLPGTVLHACCTPYIQGLEQVRFRWIPETAQSKRLYRSSKRMVAYVDALFISVLSRALDCCMMPTNRIFHERVLSGLTSSICRPPAFSAAAEFCRLKAEAVERLVGPCEATTDLRICVAEFLWASGDGPASAAAYREAAARSPGDWQGWALACAAYCRAERAEEAEECFDKVVSGSPPPRDGGGGCDGDAAYLFHACRLFAGPPAREPRLGQALRLLFGLAQGADVSLVSIDASGCTARTAAGGVLEHRAAPWGLPPAPFAGGGGDREGAGREARWPLQGHCDGCGGVRASSGLKRCGRCRMVTYCSPQCQLGHWPAHRAECRSVAAAAGAAAGGGGGGGGGA